MTVPEYLDVVRELKHNLAHGKKVPANIKNFGLINTEFQKLKVEEAKNAVVKKKDHMYLVNVAKMAVKTSKREPADALYLTLEENQRKHEQQLSI